MSDRIFENILAAEAVYSRKKEKATAYTRHKTIANENQTSLSMSTESSEALTIKRNFTA